MVPTDDGGLDAFVGCGDDAIGSEEDCDGTDLAGQTCQDHGYSGGELACSVSCAFDFAQCTGGGGCGDGICQRSDGEDRTTCPQDCDWKVLDGGEKHSCGVRLDNSAWCWGRNDDGELGTGDMTQSLTPARVAGLTEVWDVSAGWGHHSCALRLDGTVWCWGENLSGELGTGDLTPSSVPVQVAGLTQVTAVSAGKDHTCALKDDATVWCWGANDKGQLGLGALDLGSEVPVQVINLTDVVELSAGKEHNCATTTGGTLYCWGDNLKRQSDPSDPADALAPVAISAVTNVDQISSGGKHTCALLSDQTVWCWGENHRGQIGIGTVSIWEPPTQVGGLTEISAIHTGESVICALKLDQTVWCWGENNRGQLGNDNLGVDSSTPVQVSSLGPVDELVGGKKHLFARTADGGIWGWGENDQGQIGDGTAAHQPVPVPVQD